jgi:hypothetical protein
LNKLTVRGYFLSYTKSFQFYKYCCLKLESIVQLIKKKTLHKHYFERASINNKKYNTNTFSKWSTIKHGVPQGSILGPLLFLLYINDLIKIINNESVPILFVDDTSILFTCPHPTDFNKNIHQVFETSYRWFKAHLLSPTFEKPQCIQFITKNNTLTCRKIRYGNKTISNVSHTRFFVLTLDNRLPWKGHIDLLIYKLRSACYYLHQSRHICLIQHW